MKVLLVEDNSDLAAAVADYLEAQNCTVDFSSTATSCEALLEKDDFDVIVLDVMLAAGNGFELARKLREEKQLDTPILFLTALGDLENRVEGFEAGGDDYMVKPFHTKELWLRLKALESRGPKQNIGVRHFGELTVDYRRKQVFRGDDLLALNETQFDILSMLLKHAPNPVSRARLQREVWGDSLPESDPLRTHLYRLRAVLDKPYSKPLLFTHRNRGYAIVYD